MDVLSDVIAVMRSGRPRSAFVRWHAPWAQRFASVPGSAGFQVVLEGTCVLRSPGASGGDGDGPGDGDVELATGDVVFVPHGTGHLLADSPVSATVVDAEECVPVPSASPYVSDRVDPTGRGGPVTALLCGTYQLDPSRTHPLLHGLPDLIHLPAARPGRPPELAAAVELLAAELRRPGLGTDAAVPALLDTLLLYILRIWFAEQAAAAAPGASGWAAALADPAVTAALHAMHRSPDAPWTVERLAAEAGLSRAPFARRFAALVGRPPLAYLTWWRMTLAERLLRTTDAPLRTVAEQVGYGTEFAFSAAFKRVHGSAPGGYRRAARRSPVAR
ncbi:AraC family transcriptional regulator [Streptomyces sp. Root431]|uniref:AraC family transcriptional regulator n=1 Tax=Streptomyces sp. Root431 TaxID=1736535 RepID=UPI0006FBC99D|nr:AraC family transcriptional regulator [Streptomyces sp. Root431]KQX09734.1 AraC family transcriptional regulator [Streptomyces sp. Root431]